MSLVRSLVRRYSYRGEQLEDLVQIGAIGLIKTIDRFDLDRGVELTTYATPNIIGEVKRHFRDKGWSVRVPLRAPGAERPGLEVDRAADGPARPVADDPRAGDSRGRRGGAGAGGARKRAHLQLRLALDRRGLGRGGELDPLESLGEIEQEYEVSEDRAVLAPGFKVLDERERNILHLWFFRGMTQSQIAAQIGISQMHVSRLIRRSLEKIREEIAEESEVA
jgi:RNA polymerase sigma-B factor